MPTKIKSIEKSGESQIKLYDQSQSQMVGGENRPLEYPHLYQIQAGDWRISYAVEHNRLAILVLEVLTPEGFVVKDPKQEKIAQKMKIKLLDWSKDSVKEGTPPEEIGKKLKIKLLDLSKDMAVDGTVIEEPHGKGKIKLLGSSEKKMDKKAASQAPAAKRKITLFGSTQPAKDAKEEPASEELEEVERKVTPVDSPSE